MLRSIVLASLVLFAAFLTAPSSQAQPGGGAPPDFAQMRQQFADQMKEMLGATDEEWKALQPIIDKVQQVQRDASGRGMGFGRGFGGPGGPGGQGDQPQSATQQAATALREVTDDERATPQTIKTKLDALRNARAKAREELSKLQEELRGFLTARQEAVLVMIGVLE
jgi:Spy/CpxP family protein refolding chaperone